MLLQGGTDATDIFEDFHSNSNSVLGQDGVGAQFEIGLLADEPAEDDDEPNMNMTPPGGHPQGGALASLISDSQRAVGGGDLFSTDDEPSNEMDVTIPAEELPLLKNVLEMEELAM